MQPFGGLFYKTWSPAATYLFSPSVFCTAFEQGQTVLLFRCWLLVFLRYDPRCKVYNMVTTSRKTAKSKAKRRLNVDSTMQFVSFFGFGALERKKIAPEQKKSQCEIFCANFSSFLTMTNVKDHPFWTKKTLCMLGYNEISKCPSN